MLPALKRVCVTGGAGFIGSHLLRELLDGGFEVVVIDNLSVGLRENVPSQAEFIEGDILNPEVADAAADCDAVIHLAARVAIRSSFEFIVEDTGTNVVGTASLLRAVSSSGSPRVRKFLFASSMAVYAEGADGKRQSEDHDIAPLSPYGVSKFAAEMLVQNVCDKADIDAGILRLFNTYGKGQLPSPYVGVATIFTNAMRQGVTPTIFGDGRQMRDFVHVADVVQGFMKALTATTNGEVYNIGSGTGHTVNEVYDAISTTLGFDKAPLFAASVPGELRYSVADITKAKEKLGYQPRYSFPDSIGSVVR